MDLYVAPNGNDKWQALGRDRHSIVADITLTLLRHTWAGLVNIDQFRWLVRRDVQEQLELADRVDPPRDMSVFWRVGLRPDHSGGSVAGVALISGLCLCSCLLGCAKHQETGRPETLILSGWNNYRLGEFSFATRDFEAAMKKAPQGEPEHLGALYGLATTWNLRRPGEDTDRAAQLFRQVIALAPTNDLAAWSWLALARMKAMPVAGESPELNAQVLAYQDVIDRFPFHSAGEEAFLFQQAARLETPDVDRTREVLAALERFIEIHPKSPWLSSAYGLVAHCCTVLNLPDQRFAAILKASKAAEIDPLNPIQDLSVVYWQLATMAEFDLGDFALAREYYRRLIAEYPKEQRVFLAKQELKRMDEVEIGIRRQMSDVRSQTERGSEERK